MFPKSLSMNRTGFRTGFSIAHAQPKPKLATETETEFEPKPEFDADVSFVPNIVQKHFGIVEQNLIFDQFGFFKSKMIKNNCEELCMC